ncbi:unnamed protein product [Mesocestoides corti]|uniref:Endonuclease/exonuclease/phosphatase domain-containing protein n=1 Tax=Mesocestoides corti TaxID=53468 RepID=A0A0R3U836_MESCO|nr:unnamed protein product [Mesocestoides corti]
MLPVVASCLSRYPCLGESVAQVIVARRQRAPLKRLKDVWYLEAIRQQLLAEIGLIADDTSPPPEVGITERAPPPPPFSASSVPNESPRFPFGDSSAVELFQVLKATGLIDSWEKYVNGSLSLCASDSVPASTYRLATWNLDRITVAKAKHPGIREAICLTILRHQIDLIAFQEVVEPEAVQLIVDEMNLPVLPMVKRWAAANQQKHGTWAAFSSNEKTGHTFQSKEYSSFLYRSDRVKAISSRVLGGTNGSARPFSRSPFMGKFKLNSSTLILTSVHLKAPGLRDSQAAVTTEEVSNLADLVDAMKDTLSSDVHYAILGDFNLDPSSEAFDALRSRGLSPAIPSTCATMVTAVERSPTGQGGKTTSCFDNVWLCPSLSSGSTGLRFTGVSVVVNTGLRHPLIPRPDLAGFGGLPSDHCPVYFDLACSD